MVAYSVIIIIEYVTMVTSYTLFSLNTGESQERFLTFDRYKLTSYFKFDKLLIFGQ